MSSYYHRVPSFTNMQIQLDLMPDYDKQTLFQILDQKKAFEENPSEKSKTIKVFITQPMEL